MANYTVSHWGTYEFDRDSRGRPKLQPYRLDADPSPIGLYQFDTELARMRVKRPAIRKSFLEGGPGYRTDLRGKEPFVEVDWDHALDVTASAIDKVRKENGNNSIFGGSYGWASAGRFHHAQSQVHRFLNSIGGYVRHADSYSLAAGRVLTPHIVASMDYFYANQTSWEVLAESTELFIAFGGVPEKNAQVTAGGVSSHRVPGALRKMAQAGVRFVNVSPVNDNLVTGKAVDWIAIRPNTDTALMLGMAWTLENDGLVDRAFMQRCTVGYEKFRRYLMGETDNLPKTPLWAEAITGVAADSISQLARDAASSRTMLNITWSLQRATHGEQPYWMLITLASMLGQIGTPGGGFGLGYGATNLMGSTHASLDGPTLSQLTNPVTDFIPVARIADMLLNPGKPFAYNGQQYTYPDIKLIYWAGGNPFHHHQDLNRLMRAWQKPDTIVVNEQFWNATAKYADIVLPATTTVEREDIGYATGEPQIVAMSKAAEPIGESRDDHEIFSGLAARLGTGETFTEGRSVNQWLEHLFEAFRERALAANISVPAFADFREQGVVDLRAHDRPVVMLEDFAANPDKFPLKTPSGKIEIFSETIAGFGLADCRGHASWIEPKEWLGAAANDGSLLHLLSDQPVRRLHSQLDPSPWSQAAKIRGREPVYINPLDAAARGVSDGDVVELSNGRGRCLAGAVVSEVVMAGVVRLSTGAWFDPDPHSGVERHGNPNALTLDTPSSDLSQGCAAQTCLVKLEKAIGELPEVEAFTLPELIKAVK